MKKIAFVVEGQTEQIFILKFIEHMVALQPCNIELLKYHANRIIKISSRGPGEDATHQIQLINVENDELVLSYIQDNLEAFKDKGFSAVYGLRDRYTGDKKKTPVNPGSVDRMTQFLQKKFDLSVEVTVAIEEVEAWFLTVPDFFLHFNNRLTLDEVNTILGMDLTNTQVEQLSHPAMLIDKVLQSVGLAYKKKLGDSYKIAERLDYSTLYLEKIDTVPALNRFVGHLTSALA